MAIPVTTTDPAGGPGSLAGPGPVAASENIHRVHVGKILEGFNGGGGAITVTFTDPGKTPAGNTGTQAAVPLAAGARRRWRLTHAFVGANKQIVVNFSGTTSVTAEIIN